MQSLQPYLILAAAWALYLFLHSAMASLWFKDKVRSAGISDQVYRLIYSILSTVLLFGLLLLNGSTPGGYFLEKSTFLKYVGMFLAAGGIFVLRATFKQYSVRQFLGLKNEPSGAALNKSGILSRIRHPMYSATILITLGFLLFDPRLPTLVSMLCIYVYIPIGIWFEEKKLVREFGELYKKYRRDVPALVPRIRFKWR